MPDNLYLDLLPVIGFQHFIALWKAYDKSKQIAHFLHRRFQREFSHFLVLGFNNFANVFAHFNSRG